MNFCWSSLFFRNCLALFRRLESFAFSLNLLFFHCVADPDPGVGKRSLTHLFQGTRTSGSGKRSLTHLYPRLSDVHLLRLLSWTWFDPGAEKIDAVSLVERRGLFRAVLINQVLDGSFDSPAQLRGNRSYKRKIRVQKCDVARMYSLRGSDEGTPHLGHSVALLLEGPVLIKELDRSSALISYRTACSLSQRRDTRTRRARL